MAKKKELSEEEHIARLKRRSEGAKKGRRFLSRRADILNREKDSPLRDRVPDGRDVAKNA